MHHCSNCRDGVRCRRRYGFFNFLGDVIMTSITGGLWIIWIFVREMRNR